LEFSADDAVEGSSEYLVTSFCSSGHFDVILITVDQVTNKVISRSSRILIPGIITSSNVSPSDLSLKPSSFYCFL
jgi:hypothetical protein